MSLWLGPDLSGDVLLSHPLSTHTHYPGLSLVPPLMPSTSCQDWVSVCSASSGLSLTPGHNQTLPPLPSDQMAIEVWAAFHLHPELLVTMLSQHSSDDFTRRRWKAWGQCWVLWHTIFQVLCNNSPALPSEIWQPRRSALCNPLLSPTDTPEE